MSVIEITEAQLPQLKVENRLIGLKYPTYFIADIAANHNGSLEEAKDLIVLAKESGADAAKFQHFRAHTILSKYGFDTMPEQLSHQAMWKKSVYQVYQEASLPWDWTPELKKIADDVGIHFFSAPYELAAVDMLDPYVPAFKVGSGDITWLESIRKIAAKQKPVFIATGASTLEEVEIAVQTIKEYHSMICLMQCNTNYTGSSENFRYIHLNVLKTYAGKFPDVVLGLSDHTSKHATVLGAVALGARVIEKHFTRSRDQEGPDHPFSMEPRDWREMVDRVRELELALGSEEKNVQQNERETVVIQRRCCRAARALKVGEILKREDIDVLRPADPGAISASKVEILVGKMIDHDMVAGEAFRKDSFRHFNDF